MPLNEALVKASFYLLRVKNYPNPLRVHLIEAISMANAKGRLREALNLGEHDVVQVIAEFKKGQEYEYIRKGKVAGSYRVFQGDMW